MVYCVNDGAVMKGWGKQQKIAGTFVNFFADPGSDLTRSLGVTLDHPGVRAAGLINRCKRFAMLFVKGEVKYSAVAEIGDKEKTDEKTYAPAILKFIDANL